MKSQKSQSVPVRKERSQEKELFWRNEFANQKRSNLNMRQYCLRHGHNESLFHAWRRTIAERDQEKFLELIKKEQASEQVNPFVQLSVVEAAPTEVTPKKPTSHGEVKLPGGSAIT